MRSQISPVEESLFGSKKLKGIIADLERALAQEEDGVAIAAPQIGVNLRLFVVSPKVFQESSSEVNKVFINPEIIKFSKERHWTPEGCLSVRFLYGEVKRSSKVTLKAKDQDGQIFLRGASGLLAQIFQHEVDHLNGILFIDQARGVKEILPEKKS